MTLRLGMPLLLCSQSRVVAGEEKNGADAGGWHPLQAREEKVATLATPQHVTVIRDTARIGSFISGALPCIIQLMRTTGAVRQLHPR